MPIVKRDRLQAVLTARGFSSDDLARRLMIPEATVAAYLAGSVEIPEVIGVRIEVALKLRPGYLRPGVNLNRTDDDSGFAEGRRGPRCGR